MCVCLFNVYKFSSVLCVSLQYEYIRLLCICSKNMKKEVLKDKRGGFLCPCRHLSNSGWVGPTCQKNTFKQPQPNIYMRQAIPIEWSYFFAQTTESHCIDCWTFLSWTLNHSLILLESSFFKIWFSLFCCFFPQELTDPTEPLTHTQPLESVVGLAQWRLQSITQKTS